MKQVMCAEIIFLSLADVPPAISELEWRGYVVDLLDWRDEDSDARWLLAFIETELDQYQFFDKVDRLAKKLGGDIVEAGRARAENWDWPAKLGFET